MTVPALEVVDVTRVYQLEGVEVTALAGVSLSIERGEYVSIVGPSGSGKSTLMHLLGALDKPSTGRLLLATGHLGRPVVEPVTESDRLQGGRGALTALATAQAAVHQRQGHVVDRRRAGEELE